MKPNFQKLVLLVVMLFSLNAAFAQQKTSCCNLTASSSAEFAALSKDESFRASHLEPLPYVYEGKEGTKITFKTPDGKEASGFEFKSATPTKNYLFVFPEWWGLNDYIKKEAEKYFKDLGNVNVIAIDLYDGKIATTREEAGKYMQEMSTERAQSIVKGAIAYAGAGAKIGTVGWCLGGGWSLQASIAAGKQGVACVMYYGMPEKDIKRLKMLKAPVLAIFAEQDKWITPSVAAEFQKNMKKAGRKLTMEAFNADHAFANPSNPQFDREATEQAYQLSSTFLKSRFK